MGGFHGIQRVPCGKGFEGTLCPPRREYSLVVSNAISEVDFAEVVNPSSNMHSCLTSSSCGPSPVCQTGTTVPNLTGLF